MEDIDVHLTYGGARKISEYEAELLDQLDESFDCQIRMQSDLKYANESLQKTNETLKKTDDAISEYCSETTENKIRLKRGWQFSQEEEQAIRSALSDKELIEANNDKVIENEDTTKITMQSIVSNAISDEITIEHVANVDYFEKNILSMQKGESKGEI